MTFPPQPEQPFGQQPGGFPPQSGQPGTPDASGSPPSGSPPSGDSPPSGGFPQPGGFPQSGGFPPSGGAPQSGGLPQSGYPQSGGVPQGGYPQSAPQAGYTDQFGQPAFGQAGYPAWGQPGGFAGPAEEPPKKSKTGLWIGLSVAIVVILAAVGVTGFVVPGFFLATNASSTPHATLQAITDGLNKHDQAALHATVCQDGNPQLGDAITKVDAVSDAKISSGPTKVSDTEYSGVIDIKYNNSPDLVTTKLASENGKWCWKDASDSPPTTSGG